MRARLPFLRTIVGLSATLALTATLALIFVRVDRVVVAQGELSGGSRSVRAPFEGVIEHILVEPGQRVAKGEPVAALSVSELRAERERAEARRSALDAELGSLRDRRRYMVELQHPRARELVALELSQAQASQHSAQSRARSYASLREDGLVPRLAHEQAETDLVHANLDLERVQLAQRQLEDRQRSELTELDASLRQAAFQLEERKLELAVLGRRESQAILVAPVDGVCLMVDPESMLDRRVALGDEVARISYGAPERFEGLVADGGRTHVRPGHVVRLRVEGYPWMLHGVVPGEVAYLSESNLGRGGFPVTVQLEPGADLALMEGMRAEARISVEVGVPLIRLLFERALRPGG